MEQELNTLNENVDTMIDIIPEGFHINNYDYEQLENLPLINNVKLIGNKSLSDFNISSTNEVENLIGVETTNRENADNNIQRQIDAITVSSDVIDVLGTYADLENYDTSSVTADDIIKVLQDSTHNDALSYYRWTIVSSIGSWVYVGSEGPFYTKSETNSLLDDYVKNTDYASPTSGGVIRTSGTYGTLITNGILYVSKKSYTDYQNASDNMFVSKGTLENVLNARIGDIDSVLDSINGEVI